VELKAAVITMIRALEAEQIEYMLAGSFSSNYYGIPRSTQDADFVLQLGPNALSSLRQRLGAEFVFDPQSTFESVTGTQCHRVQVSEDGFVLELFRLGDDPHNQERFCRKRKAAFLDYEVVLPSVEDVIVTKARWADCLNRNKDKDDLRDVLSVQHRNIDWPYVWKWADTHGTRGLLEQILRSVVTD
jgi:hypothetical protein